MKILVFSAFILLISSNSCSNKSASHQSPYFEGTVAYKGDFIRKTDKYDSIILASMAGRTTLLYAKKGNYLTEVDDGITMRLLYRKDENKSYRETIDSDTVYWGSCDLRGPKILNFTKRKKAEKILDIECDELKVFYENRTVTYYYNSDTLKIDPAWAKYSTSYNEDFYAREMKSIWLKVVIEYEDFIISQTAIKIASKKIDDRIFEIPDKPLAREK